jgi:hypothetical protein
MCVRLAMLLIISALVGYLVAPWGYIVAYIRVWIAFIHFTIRGA